MKYIVRIFSKVIDFAIGYIDKKKRNKREREGKDMKTFLQIKRLQMRQLLNEKLEELLGEEGDTNFVSIILIMVIVIAIAGIFREQLGEAVEMVFGQLFDAFGTLG